MSVRMTERMLGLAQMILYIAAVVVTSCILGMFIIALYVAGKLAAAIVILALTAVVAIVMRNTVGKTSEKEE